MHNLIEHVQWWNRLVVEIVVTIVVTILVVLTLVAVGVALLQSTQVVGLGTLIFRSGETELAGTACLAIECLQRFHILTLLGHTNHLEAVLRARKHIGTVVSKSLEERTALLLCHLAETLVHHLTDHADGIVLDEISHAALLLGLGGVVLHHHDNLAHLHLLILLEDIDGILRVGHWLGNHLWSIGVNLDATEEFLDLGLHVVHVHVAHYDDGLVVGTIPLVIVSTQCLGLETVDNAHQTDRHALAIFRTGVHLRQCTGNHAL